MKNKLVIGTRGSKLALTQTNMVKDALLAKFSGLDAEIKIINTSGDIHSEAKLADIGGKELFTREIDAAMERGEIDIAVHSLKDIPGIITTGVEVAAVMERADPRDVLFGAASIKALPQAAKLGTSSPRRMAQLLQIRPDLDVVYFRGNVGTRLEKLANKVVDATLLAKAGIDRLGLETNASVIEVSEMIPAAGQGIIAITVRPDDVESKKLIAAINHEQSFIAATCERAVLQAYEGNCHTPIAAHAIISGSDIELIALVASEDGRQVYRTKASGKTSQAEALGRKVGAELLANIPPSQMV